MVAEFLPAESAPVAAGTLARAIARRISQSGRPVRENLSERAI